MLSTRRSISTERLLVLSLAYLALPVALFLAGWVHWCLALPLTALLLWALLSIGRRGGRLHPAEEERRPHALVPLLVVATLLMVLSGIGGVGYQDTDWLKHNAILKDLIERPWPVMYEFDGQQAPLVYYVAYYLPAAACGKVLGWVFANQVLSAWSLIGLVLSLLWFQVLAGRAGWRALLLFAAFSGLDIVGQLFTRFVILPHRPEVGPLLTLGHLEGWSVGWQYSANATLWFWVPNQALVGWILSGIAAYGIRHPARKVNALFCAALAAFWSPFVALGLLPYLLAGHLRSDASWSARLRGAISIPSLSGLSLAAVAGLYYSAKLYPVPRRLSVDIPHGFGWELVPDTQGRLLALGAMVVFCLLEFGLYGFLIYRAARNRDAGTRVLTLTTILTLALIPLYRYGGMNDLAMRASIPALFILCALVSGALKDASTRLRTRVALVILVAVGSVTPLVEYHRHLQGIRETGMLWNPPVAANVLSVEDWGVRNDRDAAIIRQYIGGEEAPFFRWLAREAP